MQLPHDPVEAGGGICLLFISKIPQPYVQPQLSATLRRVAVLPVAARAEDPDAVHRRESLEPVLRAELARSGAFALFYVTPTEARGLGGARSWTTSQALPADFMARIRKDLGCDGVIFCELTAYRAYPPLLIGWKLTLVEATGGQVVWAVDQSFDAKARGRLASRAMISSRSVVPSSRIRASR